VAQYDVDILLKIAGQQELKNLQTKLGAAEKAAEGLNKNLRALNKFDVSGATRRVNIEQKLLNITRERLKLQRQFNESTSEGNRKARQAAADFIRRQRIYRQGMAQYAGPIGPGAASPIPESSPVALSTQLRGRLNRQLKEAADLQAHLGQMEKRSLETNKRLLNNQKLQRKELGKIVDEKVKGIQADKKAADRAAQNARKARRERVGAAISAGAFPLLFGGGPGMALGGAIGGGITGKTFGPASIALQVLGGAVDSFVAQATAAGQALQSTGGALEFVREKSLFSSEEAEDLAAKLEEQGKVQELATHLTNELTDALGTSGLIALQDLGATTDETTKLWNQLTTQLQILISGPLNGFLELVNKILGAVNEGLKPTAQQDFVAVRDRILKSGTAEQIAQIQAIEAQVRGTVSRNVRGGGTQTEMGVLGEAQALAGLELVEKAGLMPKIAVTKEDLRTITPPRSKAAGGVTDSEKAAAALRKAQERLQIMQQEGSLARELKKLDFERATEIDKINKLESATTEERLAATDATNKLFEARKGEAIGKALGEDLQKAIKLKEAQEDVLRPLEDQRRLLEGKLEGNEEEVRLQLEIEKILRSVEGLNEKDVEAAVRKNAALEEQVKQVERLEKLYQQVGSAIENALVDGIMAAIDGTKSLQSIVSSLLKDVGKMFLQFGIRTALNSVSPSVFPLAQGGFVSSPTRALVGEGGQGEYVIPENKMRESMARYSRGARGSAVVPGAGDSGTSSEGGGTAVAAPIDVRFNVERINNVDYVTAEQFQVGLARAAQQGATEGERRAMRSLQNSSATRRRLAV